MLSDARGVSASGEDTIGLSSVDELGCGRFAGVGCAQWCFVVPSCNGRPWQVIEITTLNLLIMPGSRVRVPPFPPEFNYLLFISPLSFVLCRFSR